MDGAASTAVAGLVTSCPLGSWDQSSTVTWKRSGVFPWFSKVNAPDFCPAGATMLVGNNDTLPAHAGTANNEHNEMANKRFNISPPKQITSFDPTKTFKVVNPPSKENPRGFPGALRETVEDQ